MKETIVYLSARQMTETAKPEVFLKDIADIYCRDKAMEARVKMLKVTDFRKSEAVSRSTGHRKEIMYVGKVLDLVRQIEALGNGVQINSIGETEFLVCWRPHAGGRMLRQWIKTIVVASIAFFGAAFAIMTFNNDSGVSDIFRQFYLLVTGMESDGQTILEFSYSIGLSVGILVFFNHFASWKISDEPTPIEVEMQLYEENMGKAVIRNHESKDDGS